MVNLHTYQDWEAFETPVWLSTVSRILIWFGIKKKAILIWAVKDKEPQLNDLISSYAANFTHGYDSQIS